MQKLKTKRSEGFDSLSTKLVQKTVEEIAIPLAILNWGLPFKKKKLNRRRKEHVFTTLNNYHKLLAERTRPSESDAAAMTNMCVH